MKYILYNGDSLSGVTCGSSPRKRTFTGWRLKGRLKEEAGRAPPRQPAWLPCGLFAVKLSFCCREKFDTCSCLGYLASLHSPVGHCIVGRVAVGGKRVLRSESAWLGALHCENRSQWL